MVRKAFMICVLGVCVAGGLSACNTAEGFGQDMEAAGQKIQEAID